MSRPSAPTGTTALTGTFGGAVYTNLHDTIGFVNPHDVHHWLVAFDATLFGIQPCVWAERFISRDATELMSFLYVNFVWIAPCVPVVLLGYHTDGSLVAFQGHIIVRYTTNWSIQGAELKPLPFAVTPARLAISQALSAPCQPPS